MTQTRAQTPQVSRLVGAPPDERSTAERARATLRPASETARALPVLLPVAAVGAVVTVAAVLDFATSEPSAGVLAGVLALLVATAIAEALPVPIEGVAAGRTSLATVSIVATAALYGWAPATLVGAAAMAIVELGSRRPASRVVFNVALYALAAAAAGATATIVGGSSLAALALGTVLAAGAFYLVNIGLLAAVVARASGG